MRHYDDEFMPRTCDDKPKVEIHIRIVIADNGTIEHVHAMRDEAFLVVHESAKRLLIDRLSIDGIGVLYVAEADGTPVDQAWQPAI